MLYVVYVNNEGFICTFNKATNSYTTTKDIDVADFNDKFEDAQSTAEFYKGVVLAFKEKDD